jgi:hypothetical protein
MSWEGCGSGTLFAVFFHLNIVLEEDRGEGWETFENYIN